MPKQYTHTPYGIRNIATGLEGRNLKPIPQPTIKEFWEKIASRVKNPEGMLSKTLGKGGGQTGAIAPELLSDVASGAKGVGSKALKIAGSNPVLAAQLATYSPPVSEDPKWEQNLLDLGDEQKMMEDVIIKSKAMPEEKRAERLAKLRELYSQKQDQLAAPEAWNKAQDIGLVKDMPYYENNKLIGNPEDDRLQRLRDVFRKVGE